MDETALRSVSIGWVKQFALTALAGALGFGLAWGAWTLVTDHYLLQTLAAIESQRQAAARPLGPTVPGK